MPRATFTFEYETVEKFGDDLIFKDGVDWVAVCRASDNPTEATDFVVRDAAGKLLKRVAGSPNVIIREAPGGEVFDEPLEVKVYHDKTQVDSVILKQDFYIKFVASKPIMPPVPIPEPEPVPVPAPPEDIEPYRVIWPYPTINPGVNVRADHHVKSSDIGDIPFGATVECDTARFFIGEYPDNAYGWLPIASGPFINNWVAFYRFGPDGPFDIEDEYLVLAEDWTEPEPQSPTVQLTGAVQIQKRPDNFYRFTNLPKKGYNMRSFPYWSDKSKWDMHLQWMRDNGFHFMRLYVASEGLTMADCLSAADRAVDKCEEYAIQTCIVMEDSIRDSGRVITANLPWHKGPMGHLTYDYFTGRHYEPTLWPWVDTFSRALGDRAMMIDICNEPGLYPTSGNSLNITQAMTDEYIRCFAEACRIAYVASGGRVPITVGWINANHFKPSGKLGLAHAREVAARMRYMSAYSCHVYSQNGYHPLERYEFEENCQDMDFIAAREAEKPIVYTEFGTWWQNPDRDKSIDEFQTRNDMAEQQFYWGFELKEPNPEGDGHCMSIRRDGQERFDKMVAAHKT